MPWLTDALGGPVLAWEVKRATRRKLWRWLQIAYCAWLFVQALTFFPAGRYTPRPVHDDPWGEFRPLSGLALQREMDEHYQQFLGNYLGSLLRNQLLFIIAVTPAFTASALGQEKERGTLFALFCTQLSSRQILLGVLLGQLFMILPLILSTLPMLVFIAILAERTVMPVFLALLQQVIITIAVGAAGLLFGIWVRRSVDAIIAAYFFLGVAYLMIRSLAAAPGASWFYPVDNLNSLLKTGPQWEFVAHLDMWVLLGGVCLGLGWACLRHVCVDQHDRKPLRRLWAFRPPVGDDPIQWRESHVIGLAPLPILRLVPRWLALSAVFVFSSLVCAMILCNDIKRFISALLKFDVADAVDAIRVQDYDVSFLVPLMGLQFILLASLMLGVRCAMSVPEEKRRNTWDDLLLTAQSFREITNGKMWGILRAMVPYIIAYALPVFLMAAPAGPKALLLATVWIILPSAAVYVAAWMGIDMVKVPPDMDETRQSGAVCRGKWGPD